MHTPLPQSRTHLNHNQHHPHTHTNSNNNNNRHIMIGSLSPYYSTPASAVFTVVALVYSAASHLMFGCFCHFPFGIRLYKELPPTPPVPTAAAASASATDDGSDSERIVIVTGSNTGIGLETARTLVHRGYTVVMACRSRDRALEAVEDIMSSSATTTATTKTTTTTKTKTTSTSMGKAVFVHPLDLTSSESIKDFSKAIAEKYNHIDILINNAGRNTSGPCNGHLDLCYQTNFLGHFSLTRELMPLLLRKKNGRVVNLASVMHHYTRDSGAVHDYTYWKNCALYGKHVGSTYNASKLAALLFTIELRKRFPDLTSIAVNPGAVNSDIWRGFPRFIIPIFQMIFLSSQQGSTCSVAAALLQTNDDNDNTDLPLYLQPYWQPIRLSMVHPILETVGLYAGYVPTGPRLPADGGAFEAYALWKASEDVTGCKFE